MKNHRLTFSEQVASLEARNASLLIKRALAANNLAKATQGHSRTLAYQVKAQATAQLVAMKWATVVPDAKPNRDIILIRFRTNGRGLHLLRHQLHAA